VTNDAAVFVGHITAQGTSDSVNQLPLWLQETQAIAAVATTIGVLIALYVAVIREPRKAAEERRRHKAQIDALRRVRRKRVAAQARKVVPSCVRTPMFGDSWWTVRIENTSNAVTTILAVDVEAIDANGIEVPDGCKPANNTMPVDQAFDRSVLAALSGSSAGGFEQSSFGEMTFAGAWRQQSSRLPPALKQALRDALVGHFATAWQRTLPPNQHAVMAYITTQPDYTLRVTIEYEDETGFLWRRTDTSQPKLIGKEPL
jgi:hypothetical protein